MFICVLLASVIHEELISYICALYTKLRSIHHFKGLDKGCVTGASYTREIVLQNPEYFRVLALEMTDTKLNLSFSRLISIFV